MGPPPPSRERRGKDGLKNQSQSKNNKKNQKDRKDGSNSNSKKKPQQYRESERGSHSEDKKRSESDELSTTVPIPLQQLLLNIFRSALLFSADAGEGKGGSEETPLAITPLIQTLKTHLYNRDFISAFADADEDLLRAYALRWSAGRALGYVGVLNGVWRNWVSPKDSGTRDTGKKTRRHALCIGGGAGAEIVALAAVWRMLMDEAASAEFSDDALDGEGHESIATPDPEATGAGQALSITAVDIADWSPIVNRLSKAIQSPSVPATKSCRAPLIARHGKDGNRENVGFDVSFEHLDILGLSDEELQSLLSPDTHNISNDQTRSTSASEIRTSTDLVTLMFTLNELFSTSIPKATSFLLRMTDLLEPGTILLVVDSPGSYSNVALGKKDGNGNPPPSSASNIKEEGDSGASTAPPQQQKPRSYPMRFLLDHALLSVAAGSWECVLSDDSRWFRREAAKLSYDVGEGIVLEDMRFQVHVYRRLKG